MGRIAVVAVGSALIEPASAQIIPQYFPSDVPGYAPNFTATVPNRMISATQGIGTEVGDFILHPQLGESAGYNSSVLDAPNTGSSSLESRAQLSLASDWTRDALAASFSVDNNRFFDLPEETYTNWNIGVGGTVNLGNDVVTLAASHNHLNLVPTGLGVFGTSTPVPYALDDVRLSYQKVFARISLIPSFRFQNYSFGSSSGKAPVSFGSISHLSETGTIETRFDVTPGDAIVGIVRYSTAQFKARSSNYSDFVGFAGLDERGSTIFQYRALAGIDRRSFSGGSSITMPTVELNAVWMPTDLDTATFTATRELVDPVSPFVSAQKTTDAGLQVDHELRTDLFISIRGEVGASQAPSSIAGEGSENQTQWNTGAAMQWNFNRYMWLTFRYNFSDRTTNSSSSVPSTSASSVPTNHTVLLSVKFSG